MLLVRPWPHIRKTKGKKEEIRGEEGEEKKMNEKMEWGGKGKTEGRLSINILQVT